MREKKARRHQDVEESTANSKVQVTTPPPSEKPVECRGEGEGDGEGGQQQQLVSKKGSSMTKIEVEVAENMAVRQAERALHDMKTSNSWGGQESPTQSSSGSGSGNSKKGGVKSKKGENRGAKEQTGKSPEVGLMGDECWVVELPPPSERHCGSDGIAPCKDHVGSGGAAKGTARGGTSNTGNSSTSSFPGLAISGPALPPTPAPLVVVAPQVHVDPPTDLHLWSFQRHNPLGEGGRPPWDGPEWPGPLVEVIVENTLQPTLEDLQKALGKVFGLPPGRVRAVKLNWAKHQWVRLTAEMGIKKAKKKGAKKKGAGGGDGRRITNLREAPYSLQDGDVVAVVDTLEDPGGLADLSCPEDKVVVKQAGKAGARQARRATENKAPTSKNRGPEAALMLGGDLDDGEDYWEDSDEDTTSNVGP
ncbi:unnamed protein product [Discosporangium mesarthrocarpum]